MYGLVNQAIEDLVVSSAGTEAWHSICDRAGLRSVGFESSGKYDDAVTLALVAAASEVLESPAEEILRQFGRHWILYTGREGWADVFEMTGHDMQTFLAGLDEMHARVKVAMPDADMPQFSLFEKEGYLELEYHSSRDGLAPMVYGLLEGLAEYFDERWSVEQTDTRAHNGYDTFCLRPVSAEGADPVHAKAA